MRRRTFSRLATLLVVLLAGCGGKYVEVESTTRWSGAFGNRTVDGSGGQRVELATGESCAVIQKETQGGTLRARVIVEGGVLIFWDNTTDWVTTNAAWGVVTVCDTD